MIEVTVLFATRNGANVLSRTLEGYVRLTDPGFGWKIVMVDNGSTDETPAIAKHYADRLPMEILIEPVPGKNRALNLGIQAIEGDLIIITDDDAIPQLGFLTAWRRVFDRQLGHDVFGGSIIPSFEVEPPEWMSRNYLKYEELFAARIDVPDGPIDPLRIYGPNMAARRSVVAALKFNELIGPNGADPNYAMGSENDFCFRASAYGHKTWFAGEPTVWHIVRPHQLTPDYWRKRAYRLGRGAAQQQWARGDLFAKRRHALVKVAAKGWREMFRILLLARTLRPSPLGRFEADWDYSFYCGFHEEHSSRKAMTAGIVAAVGESSAMRGKRGCTARSP